MSQQWGQGQPGYQYPMQTGFPQGGSQFQPGFGGGGLAPQPTGFPGQRPGFQQPQQTGFPGAQGFQPQQTGFQPQQTGYPGAGSNFQQQGRPPIPPVPPLPTGYQPAPTNPSLLGPQPPQGQVNRFLSPSPGLGGPGLVSQPTGFRGPGGLGGGGLVPQMTGFIDPRLQMMQSTFMPANLSTPFAPGGVPQFANGPQQQQGMSLQQSFQQHNQAQRGTQVPKIPWALSRAEKKNYDQIFRAWAQGSGFIDGQTALEVFGQSGLDKNDLARIWTLADTDNRGKLDLSEFHIAMGLIYRRLNGNDIPDVLPPELVPASRVDLSQSVDFVAGLLENESRSRSASGLDGPVSKAKSRSFNDSSPVGAGGRKDATVYKHSDDDTGSVYRSSKRHINRDNVRTGNESPLSDLSDVRRQLENAAHGLEKATSESAARTKEDEELEREMEDLKYRVRRVKEDLEYVSRGPRTSSKDEERRKLDRELIHLLHERIPELERKMRDREARKEQEKREWTRERDRRNERFGRYDDRDGDRYSSSRRYGSREREEERERDRGYNRGTFDRDDEDRFRERERDRDRDYDRDRSYRRDRSRDRDYDRDRPRSPAPPPPSNGPSDTIAKPAPAPPVPTGSPSPATFAKKLTPDEVRAEAQRKVQERMRTLGVIPQASFSSSPSPSPALDSTVEDRLAAEKKEAEEKAKLAEKQEEERERTRRDRLASEKALKDGSSAPSSPVVSSPVTSALKRTPAPPAPKPRAPAPPPPRKTPAVKAPASPVAPPPAVPTFSAPTPTIDPEEERMKEREESLRKQREARAERLRQLEREEEEARLAEEQYQKRREAFLTSKSPPPPSPVAVAPPPPPAPVRTASIPVAILDAPPAPAPPPPPPPPPPAPSNVSSPAATSTPGSDKASTNPFSRLMNQSSAASPAATTAVSPTSGPGSTNPFFRPQPTTTVPQPSQSPAPPAVKSTYTVAPSDTDEDWDVVNEKDQDESSDEDEFVGSRDTRNKLAQQLFGSILPARPQSAAGSGPSESTSSAPPPAPAPPPPPSAPPAPPAPTAPAAPPPPMASASPAVTGDRSALLGAIQSGARLRKTVTNDRSAAAVAGAVIGDTAPPAHINATPRPPSPPPEPISTFTPPSVVTGEDGGFGHAHRQSVDWYAGLAADTGAVHPMPSMREVPEEEPEPATPIPTIQVNEPVVDSLDPFEDVDRSTEYRVRSLYAYEGQRTEDLSFVENLVITAHPSKSGGDWWYGTLVKDGKQGFFPNTYVQMLEQVTAKALYDYTGGNADEWSFSEGDELVIVDRGESDWWKTEQNGIIFIVPAAYLEVVEDVPLSGVEGSLQKTQQFSLQVSDHSADVPQLIASTTDDGDSEEEDGSLSFESDSEVEDNEDVTDEEQKREYEKRQLERQRVLEAAGLIVKEDKRAPPPPRPLRAKSVRMRRPPPLAPQRASVRSDVSDRELPALPEPLSGDSASRLNDAYDRYEAFKQTKNNNRLSVASVETPSSPTSSIPVSLARSASREGDGSAYSHFLHLLGRKTPGTDEEKKAKLTISAPIMLNSLGSPHESRENSPAFGLSWASLVDKSVLDDIPTHERRRQEAIFELINTESTYVRDLQLIVEVFYSSMVSLLDKKAITVIFANIEDILLTNTTFLSSLEERQRDCRLYVDTIGDLLRKHMTNMDIYMEYCVNEGAAIKVLQSLRESKPELAAHLQRLRENPAIRGLDLSSYLLAPMQRITRYPLLIRQILNHTDVAQDRKETERSLRIAERILNDINEGIRTQEGQERLKSISQTLWIGQGRLDLTAPTRFMGTRQLLKEGVLFKAKSGRKLRGFLCSDILVLTEDAAKTLYRMPIPLSELEVKELQGRRDDLAFQLELPYPRGGEAIGLRASSAHDCHAWMQAINNAVQRCKDAEQKAHKSPPASG